MDLLFAKIVADQESARKKANEKAKTPKRACSLSSQDKSLDGSEHKLNDDANVDEDQPVGAKRQRHAPAEDNYEALDLTLFLYKDKE